MTRKPYVSWSMRKLTISFKAVRQLKALPRARRSQAAEVIGQLKSGKELGVRMLSTEKAPYLLALSVNDVVVAFRQLGSDIVVLGVFDHSSPEVKKSHQKGVPAVR